MNLFFFFLPILVQIPFWTKAHFKLTTLNYKFPPFSGPILHLALAQSWYEHIATRKYHFGPMRGENASYF